MEPDEPIPPRFPFRGLPDDLDAGEPAPESFHPAAPPPDTDRRWKAYGERIEAEILELRRLRERLGGEARDLLAEITRWKEEVVREVADLRFRVEGAAKDGEASALRLATRDAEARGALEAIGRRAHEVIADAQGVLEEVSRRANEAIEDAQGRLREVEERFLREGARWLAKREEEARPAGEPPGAGETGGEEEGFRTHLDRVLARRVLPALDSARKRADELEESLRAARREAREAIGAQATSLEELRHALERGIRGAEESFAAGAEELRKTSASEGLRAVQAARSEVARLRAEVRQLQAAVETTGQRRFQGLVLTIVAAVIAAAIVAAIIAAS